MDQEKHNNELILLSKFKHLIEDKLITYFGKENTSMVRDSLDQKQKQLYAEYLDSKLWRGLKAEFTRSIGSSCEVCGLRGFNEVHHISYIGVPGKETPDQLVAVCSDCHKFQHIDKNPSIDMRFSLRPAFGKKSNLPKRLGKNSQKIRIGLINDKSK